MEKDEVIEFLENRLQKIKKNSPDAFSIIDAYDRVVLDLMDEEV